MNNLHARETAKLTFRSLQLMLNLLMPLPARPVTKVWWAVIRVETSSLLPIENTHETPQYLRRP